MKIMMILAFVAGLSLSGHCVLAASDRCVVKESEGNILVLECRGETDKFAPGSNVKIKTDKRSAPVEGC